MNVFFKIADFFLFPIVRLLFGARQMGKENIPKE